MSLLGGRLDGDGYWSAGSTFALDKATTYCGGHCQAAVQISAQTSVMSALDFAPREVFPLLLPGRTNGENVSTNVGPWHQF